MSGNATEALVEKALPLLVAAGEQDAVRYVRDLATKLEGWVKQSEHGLSGQQLLAFNTLRAQWGNCPSLAQVAAACRAVDTSLSAL